MSTIFRKLITVCGYYELCLLKVKRCTLRQTQGDKKNSHKFNNLWELSACCPINSAERGGFEPPVPEGTTVFETATIDHSAISPILLFFCSEKYDILTLQM